MQAESACSHQDGCSGPAALLGVCSNVLTALPDVDDDQRANKRTWPVRHGMASARRFASAGIAFAAFGVFFCTPGIPLPAKALVAIAPLLPLLVGARSDDPLRAAWWSSIALNSLVALWIAAMLLALAAEAESSRRHPHEAHQSHEQHRERHRPATPARECTQFPTVAGRDAALARVHARRETDCGVHRLQVSGRSRRPNRSSGECLDPASRSAARTQARKGEVPVLVSGFRRTHRAQSKP